MVIIQRFTNAECGKTVQPVATVIAFLTVGSSPKRERGHEGFAGDWVGWMAQKGKAHGQEFADRGYRLPDSVSLLVAVPCSTKGPLRNGSCDLPAIASLRRTQSSRAALPLHSKGKYSDLHAAIE